MDILIDVYYQTVILSFFFFFYKESFSKKFLKVQND